MDARRKRLMYQAHHRGMKETDLYVGRFADAHLADLSDQELDEFEAILEVMDIDLVYWLTGKKPIPPEHDGPVLRKMMAFNPSTLKTNT